MLQPLPASTDVPKRQAMMATCAHATRAELERVLGPAMPLSDVRDIRPTETGLVMVRGRSGGDGAPFNVGEATVTRAAVVLPDGATGFAFHLGRDVGKARAAAIIDALWQGEARAGIEAALAPLRARIAAGRLRKAEETAATRVNFFTLARGED